MPDLVSPRIPSVRRPAWPLVYLALGVALAAFGVQVMASTGRLAADSDFSVFYEAAWGWRTLGDPSTSIVNLSTPALMIVVWPLTFLPLWAATTVWLLLGLVCVVDAIGVTRRRCRIDFAWAIAAAFLLAPAFYGWVFTQVTWILLACVTRAWATQAPWRAALWLAPAIAIKPPLALLAIALPWPILVRTGVTSVMALLFTVAITGLSPWVLWVSQHDRVTWLSTDYNLSLIGVVARFAPGVPLGRLPWLALGACALIAIVLWALIRRVHDHDRRWLYAGWWSVAVSPAGWIYYWPVFLGPWLASWRPTPAKIIAICALGCPFAVFVLLPSWRIWLAPASFYALWWLTTKDRAA